MKAPEEAKVKMQEANVMLSRRSCKFNLALVLGLALMSQLMSCETGPSGPIASTIREDGRLREKHSLHACEERLKGPALEDFRAKLEESSLDLTQLLSSYWEEFKTLSLDLVLVAKNNTLERIKQAPADKSQQQYYEATSLLYDSMFRHLANYETVNSAEQFEPMRNQRVYMDYGTHTSSVADINNEISTYFRRLHLIQAKRLLDARLKGAGEIDLECLSKNLHSEPHIEQLLNEFTPITSTTANLGEQQSLRSEQMKLTLSINQSLEFARTLLSSLTLAKDMFQSLTQQPKNWTHASCHHALARMTHGLQCHASYTSSTARGFGRQLTSAPAQTCKAFCLNVVRACMADIYDLDVFWSKHVSALASFKTNMIQMNNIENVMTNLDEKLINFISKLQQQYNSSTLSLQSSNNNNNNNQEQQYSAMKSVTVSLLIFVLSCISFAMLKQIIPPVYLIVPIIV